MAQLADTYRWARNVELSKVGVPFLESVKALRGRPLVVVGSGGSLSACTFVARLHETHARLSASVLTPLEFIHHSAPQAAGVLLLSAGGSNPDVLTAAKHAIASEYVPVVGLCTRKNTKLKALLSQHRHVGVFEFVGPSKKDGFLATNSLLLTCTILARAYDVELPETLPALEDLGSEDADQKSTIALDEAFERSHVLALAEGWAKPAAVDLESRWAESGFGSVTVTDARNFAHGRHHGFSRRLADTLVLGFAVASETESGASVPQEDVLARTLACLPRGTAVSTLRSPLPAESGALDLLVRSLLLAGEAGRWLGLDPGQPRVPAFGRKLYHAAIPQPLLRGQKGGVHFAEDLWIRRKVTPVVWNGVSEEVRETWRARCRAWVLEAESTRVGGIVLDYDGTLCEADERFDKPASAVGDELTRLLDAGMLVGIATGRGKSTFKALRAIVPRRTWSAIIVGVYNGAVCCRLDKGLPNLPSEESMKEAFEILLASPVLTHVSCLRRPKPRQLSVLATQPLPDGLLRRFVTEALNAAAPTLAVQVLASGHSVDVISPAVSKLNVVAEVERALVEANRPDLAIMTIGDQGQAGGNDAAFLARPLGISVEYASSDFAGCWNVAPRGARRTAAVLNYLSAFRSESDSGFRWSVMQASQLPLPDVRGGATARAARSSEKSIATKDTQ